MTSAAIARDYVPREEAPLRAEPVPGEPASAVGATTRN